MSLDPKSHHHLYFELNIFSNNITKKKTTHNKGKGIFTSWIIFITIPNIHNQSLCIWRKRTNLFLIILHKRKEEWEISLSTETQPTIRTDKRLVSKSGSETFAQLWSADACRRATEPQMDRKILKNCHHHYNNYNNYPRVMRGKKSWGREYRYNQVNKNCIFLKKSFFETRNEKKKKEEEKTDLKRATKSFVLFYEYEYKGRQFWKIVFFMCKNMGQKK